MCIAPRRGNARTGSLTRFPLLIGYGPTTVADFRWFRWAIVPGGIPIALDRARKIASTFRALLAQGTLLLRAEFFKCCLKMTYPPRLIVSRSSSGDELISVAGAL